MLKNGALTHYAARNAVRQGFSLHPSPTPLAPQGRTQPLGVGTHGY
jgi:hypothetical protein